MTQDEATDLLNRLGDGQEIRVTVASGHAFDGIFNGENTSLTAGLYFDTLDGRELRADWENVAKVDFRSRSAAARGIMVPPEHPLAPQSDRLRAYTTRNR